MANKLSIEYIAGLVDGEGTIGIQTPGNTPYLTLSVANTNFEIISLLKEQFGGSISHRAPKKENHKICYNWALQHESAVQLIKQIEPYLIIKKHQAQLAALFAEELSHMIGLKCTWESPTIDMYIEVFKRFNQKGV